MVISSLTEQAASPLIGVSMGVVIASALGFAQNTFNPPPVGLEVVNVEYVEIDGRGYIQQQIESLSGKPLSAVWVASITRTNPYGAHSVLCSGTGGAQQPGVYNGSVDTYSLDDWTGDVCSDTVLRPGDVAEATWTYENENGQRVTIGTTVEIGG